MLDRMKVNEHYDKSTTEEFVKRQNSGPFQKVKKDKWQVPTARLAVNSASKCNQHKHYGSTWNHYGSSHFKSRSTNITSKFLPLFLPLS